MTLKTNLENAFRAVATQCKTLAGRIGDLSSLKTSAKSSIVVAVNEVNDALQAAAQSGGAAIDDSQAATSTVYSSSKTQNLLADKVPTSRTVNGHALSADVILGWADFSGLIPNAALPPLAITAVSVVGSEADMLALSAQEGDVAKRTDTGETFLLSSNDPTDLSSWVEVTAVSDVTSVAGKTGAVSLVVGDVSGAVAAADIGDTGTDFAAVFTDALA